MRRDPLGFLLRLARSYGDVAFFSVGRFDVYLLSDPELIRDVLVTGNHDFMKGQGVQETKRLLGEGLLSSEGDFHRRQRRLSQPAFHHGRIASYGEVMTSHGERLTERWRDGATLDVHQEMMRLTLGIVAKTLFDADIEEGDAVRVGEALRVSLQMFDRFALPFASLLEKLPLESNRRFERAKETLDEIIYGIVAEHRRTGDRGDLLSMLLSAQDEEAGGERMTDLQVRDEAMTIFLAGHETTANALTWTWYLVSQHPDVEARFHAELDEVLGGRRPTVADLKALRYTTMVVAEAMRLYPPAWILGRRALADHDVGGYTMPAGSTAVMSPYVVHHDPRWYPDPFGFAPDRFTDEIQAERPRYAYFPFGGGPRLCIGESFAWMELVLLTATIGRRWRLRLARGHPVALQPMVTLRPSHGMRMTLERR